MKRIEALVEAVEAYDNAKPAPRMKLFNYFVQYKLKNLMDVIEDF